MGKMNMGGGMKGGFGQDGGQEGMGMGMDSQMGSMGNMFGARGGKVQMPGFIDQMAEMADEPSATIDPAQLTAFKKIIDKIAKAANKDEKAADKINIDDGVSGPEGKKIAKIVKDAYKYLQQGSGILEGLGEIADALDEEENPEFFEYYTKLEDTVGKLEGLVIELGEAMNEVKGTKGTNSEKAG